MIAIRTQTAYGFMMLTYSHAVMDMFDITRQGTEPLLFITKLVPRAFSLAWGRKKALGTRLIHYFKPDTAIPFSLWCLRWSIYEVT